MDYCDNSSDRAEFPSSCPFSLGEKDLPPVEAIPASPVTVCSCSAGRYVYGPEPEGPCGALVEASAGPQTVIWPWHVLRALADHAW